jgi:hypothetical protein
LQHQMRNGRAHRRRLRGTLPAGTINCGPPGPGGASRVNGLTRPGPLAERRCRVRKAFLAVDKQVVTPDALYLADPPASIESIPRARDKGFSTAC